MEAFGVAPAGHHAAGELVDDDNLAVLDDVVDVAGEQLVGAQRLGHVMQYRDHGRRVERDALGQQPVAAQYLLDRFDAGVRQHDGAVLLVLLEMPGRKARNHGVGAAIEFGGILGRARDDQRRACLVDQDRIDLVDDGEVERPLRHRVEPVLHVVAQVVEADLVVGAVGDVAGIGGHALLVVEFVDDDADGEAEEGVDPPHPLRVAAGEVVVGGDDMHALASKGVEIDRQGGDQRLAFAGLHLGDLALVQDHAALELHVEGTLAERALGRLAHRGEGLDQQVVERLALGEAVAEFDGLAAQRLVGERDHLRLERIDLRHGLVEALDDAVVGCPEETSGERPQHENLDILMT